MVGNRIVEVSPKLAGQQVYHVVRDIAAFIEPLIYHSAEPVLLGEIVAVEVDEAVVGGIRDPDVGELAAREGIHQPAISLDPGARPQGDLVFDRHHGNQSRALHHRLAVHPDHRLPSRGAFEEAVWLGGYFQLYTVHLEEVITLGHLDAGLAEWRPQVRVPVLSSVDVRDPIPTVVGDQIGAEQADRDPRYLGRIAAAGERVPHRQLTTQDVEQVSEV